MRPMQTLTEAKKTSRQRSFEKKVDELIGQANKLSETAVRRVYALLNDCRKRIITAVAETEWEAHRLGELKGAVEASINEFAREYGIDMREWQQAGWDLGVLSVDEPLKVARIETSPTALSTTKLAILQGYSADLVKDLTADAIKRVNNDIALSLLGEQSAFEAIKKIGRDLSDPSTFKTIFHRAEAIARTEVNRVYSIANYARMKQAKAEGVDIQKMWVYDHMTKYPREFHQSMNGQIKEIDEPFVSGKGNNLMYPHDPAAPASETVMCK